MSTPTKPTPATMSDPVIAVYTRWGYPAENVNQYAMNYIDTKVNAVIIQGPTFCQNSGVGPMFDVCGNYIGDPAWSYSLNQFVLDSGVKLFYTLGNSDLAVLTFMAGNVNSDNVSNAQKVMNWFKANGFTGIDFDCETWDGGPLPDTATVETITLAAIQAGLIVTGSPYTAMTNWANWCSFVKTNSGTVGWLNLQCYSGGFGNSPAEWATAVAPVQIVAGFEAGNGPDNGAMYPPAAQTQIAAWKSAAPKGSMIGAFVWDFGMIGVATNGNYSLKEYAQAMYDGMNQ